MPPLTVQQVPILSALIVARLRRECCRHRCLVHKVEDPLVSVVVNLVAERDNSITHVFSLVITPFRQRYKLWIVTFSRGIGNTFFPLSYSVSFLIYPCCVREAPLLSRPTKLLLTLPIQSFVQASFLKAPLGKPLAVCVSCLPGMVAYAV